MKPTSGVSMIVAKQEKFDQRDSIFSRTAAGLEQDQRIRKWADAAVPDPLYRMLMGVPRSANCVTHHLISAVDGPVNPQRTEVGDVPAFTAKLKEVARFLGADRVGTAKLNPAYVASHRADEYTAGSPQHGRAIHLVHGHAISLLFRRDYHMVKAGHSFIDGNEGGLVYCRAAVTACQTAAYIRELGYSAKAHHEREEEVLHVPIAVQAGLGELGRLGLLITPEWGPRVRLATVTTDLPLAVDSPVDIGVQQFCELCGKCARACPGGAIASGGRVVVRGVSKWTIDPRKCLAFWGRDKSGWDDCSNCIAVCPYNRRDSLFTRLHRRPWFFRLINRRLFAAVLLWADDLLRGRRPRWKVRWLDYTNR